MIWMGEMDEKICKYNEKRVGKDEIRKDEKKWDLMRNYSIK